ncbi:MAG: hypothetical protein A4E42_01361 [Methanoregulaceae archaeon PtaU1.Bin222]|nr:MAG: hypothetical protein A4E42_01361 [Methanoregulaceae archaeon PtaU1.Bin222]
MEEVPGKPSPAELRVSGKISHLNIFRIRIHLTGCNSNDLFLMTNAEIPDIVPHRSNDKIRVENGERIGIEY